MHVISIRAGSHSLRTWGPIVEGAVSHSEQHREALAKSGIEVKSKVGKVLLDTGASQTCFDKSIARKLSLTIVDLETLLTPSGTVEDSPVYEGQVIINGHSFHIARASEGGLSNQGLIALIGRDILSHGVLKYDGRTGNVSFRF